MPNSTAYANGLLDYVVGRNGLLGSSLTRYMRLWTVMPTIGGTGGTEVSGGSYAALLLVVATHFNTAAASGSVSNDGQISFATATADWGIVAGTTFESLATGGTLYRVVTFSSPVTVDNGQTLRIPVSNLTLSNT